MDLWFCLQGALSCKIAFLSPDGFWRFKCLSDLYAMGIDVRGLRSQAESKGVCGFLLSKSNVLMSGLRQVVSG